MTISHRNACLSYLIFYDSGSEDFNAGCRGQLFAQQYVNGGRNIGRDGLAAGVA